MATVGDSTNVTPGAGAEAVAVAGGAMISGTIYPYETTTRITPSVSHSILKVPDETVSSAPKST